MYKCLDCGYVFEEPKSYVEDRTPGGVYEMGSFLYRWKACPMCAGAYRETEECYICGEHEIEEQGEYIDHEWICKNCVGKLESEV